MFWYFRSAFLHSLLTSSYCSSIRNISMKDLKKSHDWLTRCVWGKKIHKDPAAWSNTEILWATLSLFLIYVWRLHVARQKRSGLIFRLARMSWGRLRSDIWMTGLLFWPVSLPRVELWEWRRQVWSQVDTSTTIPCWLWAITCEGTSNSLMVYLRAARTGSNKLTARRKSKPRKEELCVKEDGQCKVN